MTDQKRNEPMGCVCGTPHYWSKNQARAGPLGARPCIVVPLMPACCMHSSSRGKGMRGTDRED